MGALRRTRGTNAHFDFVDRLFSVGFSGEKDEAVSGE
jgi:hypothetical protein